MESKTETNTWRDYLAQAVSAAYARPKPQWRAKRTPYAVSVWFDVTVLALCVMLGVINAVV